MGRKKKNATVAEPEVIVDETEEETSQEASGQEEGQPKLRGRRPIFWVCSAVVEGELVSESVQMTMPDEKDGIPNVELGAKEVFAIFENAHGIAPEKSEGPFYLYKGIQHGNNSVARKTDTIPMKQAMFLGATGERSTAIYLLNEIPWEVIVQHTTDPEVGQVFFRRPTVTLEKRPQAPTPKYLPLKVLRDMKPFNVAEFKS